MVAHSWANIGDAINTPFFFLPAASIFTSFNLSSYSSSLYFWNSLQTLVSGMSKVCRTNWLVNKHSYDIDRKPGECLWWRYWRECCREGGHFSFIVGYISGSTFANSSLAAGYLDPIMQLLWPCQNAAGRYWGHSEMEITVMDIFRSRMLLVFLLCWWRKLQGQREKAEDLKQESEFSY